MRALSRKTENDLKTMSREIAWFEEESRKTVRLALQYKLEIGKRLLRAKEMLPHGQFLRWAHSEFGWTRRHVAYHLQLAANEKCLSLLPKAATFRMAIAAIKEASSNDVGARSASTGSSSSIAGKVTEITQIEVLPPPKQVVIVGEVVEGDLDCVRLLGELNHLAAEFGAPRTRWKLR
jgi:hypothetical protein